MTFSFVLGFLRSVRIKFHAYVTLVNGLSIGFQKLINAYAMCKFCRNIYDFFYDSNIIGGGYIKCLRCEYLLNNGLMEEVNYEL